MQVFDLLIGIIIEPAVVMKKITARRPVGAAIIISLLIVLFQNLTLFVFKLVEPFFANYFVSEFQLLEILLTVILVFLGVLFITLSFQVVAKLFGAPWNYWGLFSGICFAQFVFIFFPLVALAGFLLDYSIFSLLNMLLGIWLNILSIVAIKESFSLSIGKAVATYFLTLLFLIILLFILVLMFSVVGMLFTIAFV